MLTNGPWTFDPPYIKGCREDMYPILLDAEGSGLSDDDIGLITAAPEMLALLRKIDREGIQYETWREIRHLVSTVTGE